VNRRQNEGTVKLCVLSHMYPNVMQPTKGIFVRQHVQALAVESTAVTVVSPVPWVPAWLPILRGHWRDLRAVPLSETTAEGTVYYPRFFTLPRALWRAHEGPSIARAGAPLLDRERFDLIHAHTALPDGDAARRLARRHDIPFVCTVHGYDFVWLRQEGRVREAILRTFREAAHVICVSERVRRACLEHDPRPDHFSVIHHGIAVPDQISSAERVGSGRTILSAGNLIPQKRFAELVEAFSMVHEGMPDAQLVIVGAGPEEPRLATLASQLGVDQCIRLLGRIPHAALLSLYGEADVFCLASEDEGFGIVYLEAMAHGVPVIGSAGEGIADVIVNGENGLLVPPGDKQAIAAALARLLRDGALRSRLAQAGRVTASLSTWARNAEQHVALYRRVLGLKDDSPI